jgi:hypothetical protein
MKSDCRITGGGTAAPESDVPETGGVINFSVRVGIG